MDKELKFADWTLKEIADENNNLNSGYFKTDEYKKYPAYYKLKNAIEYILKNDADRPISLLDVGCGSGWHGVYIDKENLSVEYNGADISQSMCDNAKRNCPNSNFVVLDFTISSSEKNTILLWNRLC